MAASHSRGRRRVPVGLINLSSSLLKLIGSFLSSQQSLFFQEIPPLSAEHEIWLSCSQGSVTFRYLRPLESSPHIRKCILMLSTQLCRDIRNVFFPFLFFRLQFCMNVSCLPCDFHPCSIHWWPWWCLMKAQLMMKLLKMHFSLLTVTSVFNPSYCLLSDTLSLGL
jgi:hypothetical protein